MSHLSDNLPPIIIASVLIGVIAWASRWDIEFQARCQAAGGVVVESKCLKIEQIVLKEAK